MIVELLFKITSQYTITHHLGVEKIASEHFLVFVTQEER
tara:strand:+ start:338 stop:454 length:117 start_codon:yes stop_codon:yes gene_type:complete